MTEPQALKIFSKIQEEPEIETLFVELANHGQTLQPGQKAYLQNPKKRVKTILSITCSVPDTGSITNYAGTGLNSIPPNRIGQFALTIVNTKGEILLNDYPLGALSFNNPIGIATGYKGKIRAFYLPNVDIQKSFITYLVAVNPLTPNYMIPLTFTYDN